MENLLNSNCIVLSPQSQILILTRHCFNESIARILTVINIHGICPEAEDTFMCGINTKFSTNRYLEKACFSTYITSTTYAVRRTGRSALRANSRNAVIIQGQRA